MKISKELNILATYFYTKLIESVLYDVRKNTREVVNETDLEGVEYEEKMFHKNVREIGRILLKVTH